MSSILLACALVLTGQADSKSTDSAQIEVHKGHCVAHFDGGERSLRSGEVLATSGRAHIEIGAGSEVRLQWPGRASMHVWGPAAIEWSAETAKAERGSSFSSDSLHLQMLDVAWADLEVRRGKHRLTLPGSWRADLETGAFHLRGLPSGPVEFRHHAGSPVELIWFGEQTQARPPVMIYAGSSLLLDRPPAGRVDESKNARAWSQQERSQAHERMAHKPSASVDEHHARPREAPIRHDDQQKGRVREFYEASEVTAEVTPLEQPATAQPETASPQTAQRSPEPHQTAGPAQSRLESREAHTEPQGAAQPSTPTQRPVARVAYDARHWRGLALGDLKPAGALVVQNSAHLDVRAFSSGRWKVLLDAQAKEPVWCFGPDADYELMPGAVAVFGETGNLRMKFGTIQTHTAPAGRPSFDSIDR